MKSRVLLGGFGVAAALFGGTLAFHSCSTLLTPPPPPVFEQPPAVVNKPPERSAAEVQQEVAFQIVVFTLKTLRAANRNPDSVKWESIRANDDASVICIEYRGQNGFGGMNREFFALIAGKPSQKSAVWNRHCTQVLHDMKYAARAL